MKVMLVYNPYAGHRKAEKLLPNVEALFNDHNIEFDLHLTDYPEHAIDIVSQINFDDYDGLVAAGGDGTLFEAINGYFKNNSKKRIPFGVVPLGTGNSFSLDLDLENNQWEKSIEIISRNNPQKTDVGHFNSHGQDYYFLNIIGAGFVSDVNKIARKLKIFGNFAYTLGVLYRIILLNSTQFTLEIDGEKIERDGIFIEVSNSRYTADFFMAPGAKINDGLLDITLLRNTSRLNLIKSFPKVFTGEHVNLDIVETYQAKKIIIKSNIPKVLTPDGELLGITPVEINCLPEAIEVFRK